MCGIAGIYKKDGPITGVANILSGGCGAHGSLGTQADAGKISRDEAAGRREHEEFSGRERKFDAESLGIRTLRKKREDVVASVEEYGAARGRHRVHTFNDVENEHARAGLRVYEYGTGERRISERGGVVQLCDGEHERKSADLCVDS